LIRPRLDGPVVNRTRRIGVLGGTFDPIHAGHLAVARAAAEALSLDEVIFVPAGLPWQKQADDISDAEDRYLMTVLATAHDIRFTVSRVDLERQGPTYAVDTLTDLALQHPDDQLFFIVGADALASLHTWHEPERLLSLATFIAVTRSGHDGEVGPSVGLGRDAVVQVVMAPVDISGTELRARAARGESLAGSVHPGVETYIARRGLYAG
jgi:nicotinate-nucleotide adenylyltransferase